MSYRYKSKGTKSNNNCEVNFQCGSSPRNVELYVVHNEYSSVVVIIEGLRKRATVNKVLVYNEAVTAQYYINPVITHPQAIA